MLITMINENCQERENAYLAISAQWYPVWEESAMYLSAELPVATKEHLSEPRRDKGCWYDLHPMRLLREDHKIHTTRLIRFAILSQSGETSERIGLQILFA